MAEANVLLAQDQFSCPICLDLLKDPVAIPCGHSFCMDCITDCWDQEDKKRVYSCPQCRQTFTPRPALGRNTMLAEVVEKLKIIGLQSAPPAHCYAGPGDVECDVCTGRKRKAVKSCLVCLSSYCETHLRAHNDLNPGKKHKLIDAAGKLEDLICSNHDKLLEVFCRTDKTCICLLCAMDEHKGHDTVSAAAERTERQKRLGETQKKSQQNVQDMERELQQLRQAVKTLQQSAQAAVEDSERIFTEMIRSFERKRSEVTGLIREQERAEVSRAEKLIEKLEQKVAELRRRDHELEKLSQSENHIRFLQSFQSLSSSSVPDKSEDTVHNTDLSFDEVTEKLSELRDKLEDTLQLGITRISKAAELVSLLSAPMPTTREDFLKYFCNLSLDVNTANKWLCLSEGNTRIKNINVAQMYPLHPERFANRQQVLCCQAVSGRCYWEVEWSEVHRVAIAVSYKDISRTGNASHFGYNQQSWSLECSSTYNLIHNSKITELCPAPKSPRVGVYVDHKAGVVAFYSISSDTVALLHEVQTTFTQPLYPGFWVDNGSTLDISRVFNK